VQVSQLGDGVRTDFQPEVFLLQRPLENAELKMHNALDQFRAQPAEHDHIIDAIEEFRKAMDMNNRFRIVIADNVLDEMSGLELSARLKEIDPEISFILISGWGQEPGYTEIENSGVDRVLKKPFRIEQLTEVITLAKTKLISS